MANLKEKVEAEFENIEQALNEMPAYTQLPNLSILELAGVATLIHNFYNGIENVLKQIFMARNLSLPTGDAWHKDLLNNAVENQIISSRTKEMLKEYLAFRHFFSHAYYYLVRFNFNIPLNPPSKGDLLLFPPLKGGQGGMLFSP